MTMPEQPFPEVTPDEVAAATELVGKCQHLYNERDPDGCSTCEWETWRCHEAHVIFVNAHRDELGLPEFIDPYADEDDDDD